MNTPFQYYKRVASHLGGIRNGLVISWPKHIADAGAIRPQFHHVSDIVPTILDAAAVEAPAMLDGVPQQPMDGISMAYTFEGRAALSRRTTQVFEMMNNYAIYSEGWMASTRPTIIPWDLAKSPKSGVNERTWELYDLNTDFSQSRDVAATHQGKLQQMQQLFWAEAARNNILPIHDLRDGREGAPDPLAGRSLFSYSPGFTRLPWHLAPPPTNRSFSITADVVIPESGARGVLVTKGGRFGGYAFYLHDGRLTFFYNALDPSHARIESREAVSAGTHKLTADFQSETNGTATVKLLVDGHVVASGRIERTLRSSHSEGFDVGEDTITPINDDYTIAGSRFTGELRELTIAVK